MLVLLQRLGLDKKLDQLNVVHVAGTKGKVLHLSILYYQLCAQVACVLQLADLTNLCIIRGPHAQWWRAYYGAVDTTLGYSHHRTSGMCGRGYNWMGETKGLAQCGFVPCSLLSASCLPFIDYVPQSVVNQKACICADTL